MRTTLTLDGDVADLVELMVRKSRRTLKDVINDGLRAGLTQRNGKTNAYRVVACDLNLLAGVDPQRFNQLADDLEIDELAARFGST